MQIHFVNSENVRRLKDRRKSHKLITQALSITEITTRAQDQQDD